MSALRFVFAVILTATLPAAANGQFVFGRVALSGQSAPGAGAGTTYSSLGTPALDSGRIAYEAQLSGSALTNRAYYAGPVSAPQIIMRFGNAPPGRSTEVYNGFNSGEHPVVNAAGVAAFYGISMNTTTFESHSAFYAGPIGSVQSVAAEGDAAPGAGTGVTYLQLSNLLLNDGGEVAFKATLTGTGVTSNNFDARYAGPRATPQLVARKGSQAPGAIAGTQYDQLGPILLGDNSRVAYYTTLAGPDVGFGNSAAIYVGTVGAPQLAARSGAPATGAGAGVTFEGFSLPTINGAGRVAYAATLAGPGVSDVLNRRALYTADTSGAQLVARQGEAAPGTTTNYSSFAQPILNDAGGIAFSATLTNGDASPTNGLALFAGPIGSPQMVARIGVPASPLPAGVSITSFQTRAYNDFGQFVFLADLAGTGVTSSNDAALFAYDPARGLRLVARTGSTFDVGGGILRTIAADAIFFAGGAGDDTLTGLDDAGTIAVGLRFTDLSSGIFTTTVPEPATGAIAVGVAVIFSRRRARPHR